MVIMHVWFIGIKEYFGEIAGRSETSFSPSSFLLFSRNSSVRFWGLILVFVDWESPAPWASLPFSACWS